MDNIWFKKLRWTYVPVHPLGLLVTFICLVLNVVLFVTIDSNSHSAIDKLIQDELGIISRESGVGCWMLDTG